MDAAPDYDPAPEPAEPAEPIRPVARPFPLPIAYDRGQWPRANTGTAIAPPAPALT